MSIPSLAESPTLAALIRKDHLVVSPPAFAILSENLLPIRFVRRTLGGHHKGVREVRFYSTVEAVHVFEASTFFPLCVRVRL